VTDYVLNESFPVESHHYHHSSGGHTLLFSSVVIILFDAFSARNCQIVYSPIYASKLNFPLTGMDYQPKQNRAPSLKTC